MKKNMIWSYDTSSWNEEEEREIYEECYGEKPSEQELQDYIYDMNQTYLEDVQEEIFIHEKVFEQKQYIVLADLGL